MLGRTVRIGTRRSPLAMRQVKEVITLLRASDAGAPFMAPVDNGFAALRATGKSSPYRRFEIVGIDTYGDKDRKTPISDIEGNDFFTREIEEALLKGEIDLAVHSAKDLPDVIPDGLCIAAVTGSIDPYDALVSRDNLKIDALPYGARVGASSQRRKTQLKAYREDFNIVDIRGAIEERLRLLRPCGARNDEGLDAIIVAACALIRLGLKDRIAQRIPFDILTPHPLQGALAIEVRQTDKEIIDLVKRSLRGAKRRSNPLMGRLRTPKKEIASPLTLRVKGSQ